MLANRTPSDNPKLLESAQIVSWGGNGWRKIELQLAEVEATTMAKIFPLTVKRLLIVAFCIPCCAITGCLGHPLI